MLLSESFFVRHAPRVAARVVNGKAIVIVIDGRTLHTLNELGTRVWQLADGRALGALVDAIVDEYDIGRERALDDVARFVQELTLAGALTVEPNRAPESHGEP